MERETKKLGNKLVMFLAIASYAFMTVTVTLAWFTPELEVSSLRLSIATALLIPGWYYLLSKTAAKRHWEFVKSAVRK